MFEAIYNCSSLEVEYFGSEIIAGCEDSIVIYFSHLVEEAIVDDVVACRFDIVGKLLVEIPDCHRSVVVAVNQS